MSTPDATVNVRARFKMAQRVQQVLGRLEGITSARIDDEVPTKLRDHEHRGDFLIQALDLRLRISLLVGISADSTSPVDPSQRAEALLGESPDTDAVVLVSDDDALTSLIIEPFDLSGALTVPAGQVTTHAVSAGPAPLLAVLDDYLRLLRVNWEPTESTIITTGHDIRSLAWEAAETALEERNQKEYRIPEKRRAQESLSTADARWLSSLVIEVAQGVEVTDLEDRLRELGEPH